MKPGFQTSEFLLCLLAALLPVVEPFIHAGPGASLGTTILAAVYTVARAYVKANAPSQPTLPKAD